MIGATFPLCKAWSLSVRKLPSLPPGFKVEQEEVFTCLTAARQMIERNNLRPMFLVDPAAMEDFEGIQMDDPNCVVVGLAPDSFTYDNLTKAFR